MGDEINESVNANGQIEDVSDAALDAAFQEFMGVDESNEVNDSNDSNESNEENNENVTNIQKVEHSESSRLGRKVRYLSDNMVTKDEFTGLSSKIDSLLDTLNRQKQEELQYDEYGNLVTPPVDIKEEVRKAFVETKQREQKEAEDKIASYQKAYIAGLRELIDEIEDHVVAKKVFDKMVAPNSEFNQKLSDNPYADVSKNFIRAIKSVATPFSGKRGNNVPSGVTVSNTNSGAGKTLPKLDAEAEEYAKMMGMTEDDIISALDGEISGGLKGRKMVVS
jgi:hypothetical protein